MLKLTVDAVKGDALSPLLFIFALECAIRRVQENQYDLKSNGTHRRLVYMLIMLIYWAEAHILSRKMQ